VALFNTPGPTYTSFAAGFHHYMSEDMLLRKAEVQYVAEMPLDNRNGRKICGHRGHHIGLLWPV
jgi:hypothetical protein